MTDDREDPNPRATVPDGPPPRRKLKLVCSWCKAPWVDGHSCSITGSDTSREAAELAYVEAREREGKRVTAEEIAEFAAEYARRMGVGVREAEEPELTPELVAKVVK